MMATAKKSSARSRGAKKTTSAAKKPAVAKKPATARKATPAKSVAAPKAAAKPAKPLAAPSKAAAREKAPPAPPTQPLATKRARPSKRARTVVVKAGTAAATKLGVKWTCFRCAAKFYDLNKPVPLCPKCNADQRERPKVAPTPPAPAPRKQPRPMAPLLEDEDDGTVRYQEDIDLGVRTETDEPDEELFPPGEFEEDEPFSGPEEE